MKNTLYTKSQLIKMKKNYNKSALTGETNHKPVVKWFNPMGSQTWLITEIDETETQAFGLCDLGMGTPELGFIDIEEIRNIRLPFGLKIERDIYTTLDKTMSEYAKEAHEKQAIVC